MPQVAHTGICARTQLAGVVVPSRNSDTVRPKAPFLNGVSIKRYEHSATATTNNTCKMYCHHGVSLMLATGFISNSSG